VFLFQLGKPRHRPLPQLRRLAGDRGFASLRDTRDASVERRDQLTEIAHETRFGYRHARPPLGATPSRESFHTSPHLAQRE
jgi:hypothetical protein